MISKAKKGSKGLGRPKLADADKRATLVRVLTTEAEHTELQRAAQTAGASVSTWVRLAALEKARASR